MVVPTGPLALTPCAKLGFVAAETPRNAWLLMAAGDDRGHGGNDGYDDQADAYYSWDSNVPNARRIAPGDPVAIWDKRRLLGVSVIEEIEESRGTKVLSRCPRCRTTRISERKRSSPRYRCMKKECRHEFETPTMELATVDIFRARYDAAWTALDGVLDGRELRDLAVRPGDFNAMRPIELPALRSALAEKGAERALDRMGKRSRDLVLPGGAGVWAGISQGFTETLVRVRRGQGQFRERLFHNYGDSCAFTGNAPDRVLEAGHLYSYARLGEHHEHGGLLLRRDVHRLFDDGWLAVEPSTLRVDVAPELEPYPQYARLHGQPLTVPVHDDQASWLTQHWREHREPIGARA